MGKLSKWLVQIGAAFKRPAKFGLPPTPPASDGPEEPGAEGAVAEEQVAAGAESTVVEDQAAAAAEGAVEEEQPTTGADSAVAKDLAAAGAESTVAEEEAAATADADVGQAARVEAVSTVLPHQQEIQRRRELVRALFNDFWRGSHDKPATFADRLDQAETYLNEQLTARGEPWQLDAGTRKMLGLPPRAN
jgi:hypothetical protein